MKANVTAQAFWRKVVSDFTNGQSTELHVTDGRWQGVVQQFTAPAAA